MSKFLDLKQRRINENRKFLTLENFLEILELVALTLTRF